MNTMPTEGIGITRGWRGCILEKNPFHGEAWIIPGTLQICNVITGLLYKVTLLNK